MTPHIEHKPHIRELIRGFARIDECFDDALYALPDRPAAPELYSLTSRLEYLLSFPLRENPESIVEEKRLSADQLRSLQGLIPADASMRQDVTGLRESLRDKLYEFLLRMDHCTQEQLCQRSIHVPPLTTLSLMQLQQLVIFMISECLASHARMK